MPFLFFCLSFYCASLLAYDSPALLGIGGQREKIVTQLVKEYSTPSFTFSKLFRIYDVARKLQRSPDTRRLKNLHISGITGSFYTLKSPQTILYTPPLNERYMVGKGALKKVYKALFFTPLSHEVVAACVGPKETILHEVAFFRKISDFHSSPYRCSFPLSSTHHMLVLQYYNTGCLRALRDKKHRFSSAQKRTLFKSLIETLSSMHHHGIAHRDIHDGNILLHASQNGVLTAGIIDFGRSSRLFEKVTTSPQGAPHRNPPEVLFLPFSSVDKRKSDVYALGCSLFYIFFSKIYNGAFFVSLDRRDSFSSHERNMLYEKIQKVYADTCKQVEEGLDSRMDPTVLDRMKLYTLRMIQPDPEKRVELSEIVRFIQEAL